MGEVPKKRVLVSTKNLYASIGGRVEDDEDWLRRKNDNGNSKLADEHQMSPFVTEILNCAEKVADNLPMPAYAMLVLLTRKLQL